jgi:hypothetical protein
LLSAGEERLNIANGTGSLAVVPAEKPRINDLMFASHVRCSSWVDASTSQETMLERVSLGARRGKVSGVCFGCEIKDDLLRIPSSSPPGDTNLGFFDLGSINDDSSSRKPSRKNPARGIRQPHVRPTFKEARAMVGRILSRNAPTASEPRAGGQEKRCNLAATLEHERITSTSFLNREHDS